MSEHKKPIHPILLVDDEAEILRGFSATLEFMGYDNVMTCRDEREVMDIMSSREVEIVLLDMIMPHIRGDELLREIVARFPDIPVVMVTGVDDVSSAVECMRRGAFDYLTKPVDPKTLEAAVLRGLKHRELKRENMRLTERLLADASAQPEAFAAIITRNRKMTAVFRYCEAIAPGSEPVLITGETGTGKELLARAIHSASGRKGQFVAMNVAGLDDQMLADTLFGHIKGAFTGAERPRQGMVEQAAGGTLFLDEIGDLSEASQIKLLRLLQEKEFFPLGADHPLDMDARVVVATNKNIETLKSSKSFRPDFFYRLRTHHIHIPPLRARQDDVPFLLQHFLEQAATDFDKHAPTVPPELFEWLRAYPFPGNIRELRSMVFDAVARHAGGVLSLASFKEAMNGFAAPPARDQDQSGQAESLFKELPVLPSLKQAGELLIRETLDRAEGNQRLAAAMLGISPSALSKRLKQHKMSKED